MNSFSRFRDAGTVCLILLTGLFVLLNGSVSAQSTSGKNESKPAERSKQSNEPPVSVSAFSDTEQVKPGKSFELLFHFTMKPGWHIYWKNSGEAGLKTTIDVRSPDGFSVGDIRWPRPIRFQTSGIRSFGYHGETVLFVPVIAPSSLSRDRYQFQARIEYLACKRKCIQGSNDLTITIPGDTPSDPELIDTIKKHRRSIPVSFEQLDNASFRRTDEGVIFRGPSHPGELQFFPLHVPGVQPGEPKIRNEKNRFRLKLPVSVHQENLGEDRSPVLKGVLAFGNKPFGPSYEISVPLGTGE